MNIDLRKIMYVRSQQNVVVTAPQFIPNVMVYDAGVDISLNDSQQADYEMRNVNITGGQEDGYGEKNKVYFNVSPIVKSFLSTPFLQIKSHSDLAGGTNDMYTDLFTLLQFDTYRNSTLAEQMIGTNGYNIGLYGYSNPKQYISNNVLTPSIFSETIFVQNGYKTNYKPSESNFLQIYLYTNSAYSLTYTNLKTGATTNATLLSGKLQQIPAVYFGYANDGNKVTITDGVDVFESYYYPITECKYETFRVDFIGKYGVFKSLTFFKASYESMEVKNEDYNASILRVDTAQQFNTNGMKTLKLNTGYVDEWVKYDIEELLLSETIYIGNDLMKLKTKQAELVKKRNTKLINYTIELEYAQKIIK